MLFRSVRIGEIGVVAEEGELSGRMGGDELFQDQPAEQSGQNAHQQKETGPAWCKPFAICVAPEGTLRVRMVEAPVNPLVDIQLTGAKPRVTRNDETQTAISPSVRDRVIPSGQDRQHPVSR